MIIRPQLKTHWVQSQNPLSVSLFDIEKVIVVWPKWLFDIKILNSTTAQKIPDQNSLNIIKPSELELNEVTSKRHTLSRDLFLGVFGAFNFADVIKWPSYFDDLSKMLEFHHTDGRITSLIGCHRHPDWPIFLNPEFYLTDRSCLWEKALSDQGPKYSQFLKLSPLNQHKVDLEKILLIIFEIIAWSIQRQRQIEDIEVLYSVQSEKTNVTHIQRSAYELNDILLKAEPHWSLHFEVAPSEFKSQFEVQAFLNEKPQVSKGELEQKASVSLRKTTYLLNEMFENENQTDSGLVSRHGFLRSASDITYFYNSVLKHIPHVEFEQSKFKVCQKGSIKQYVSISELNSELIISVSQSTHLNKNRQFGFSSEFKELLKPIKGGIESYLGVDRKDVASQNPLYRNQDLLLLRHSGLALFCYLEVINQKLVLPSTSGENFESDNLELFVEYLQKAVLGFLGKYGENFDQVVSKECRKSFREYISSLIHLVRRRDLYEVNQDEELIQVPEAETFALEFLRLIILHQAEVSNGKVFSKTKQAMGESFSEKLFSLFHTSSQKNEIEVLGPAGRIMPLLFELSDRGYEIEYNGHSILDGSNSFRFSFDVREAEGGGNKLGLFELDPVVFFDGIKVSPQAIQLNINNSQYGYIEFRGQIYRIKKDKIPPLRSLQLFWNRLQGIKKENIRHRLGEQIYFVPKAFALELLMLKQKGIEVNASGEWRKIIEYFENSLGQQELILEQNVQIKLLPHQSYGARWLLDLYELRLGAILADEMGLGKTFQVLSFFQALSEKKTLGINLIIVPTSVLYNWMDERKKFTPDLPFVVFDNSMKSMDPQVLQNESKIILTTYGHLIESLSFFEKIVWNSIIFDEAQNLKNILSQRSVAARQLKAHYKVCLTGTPLENNYLEFYSLCDLVVPGSLGDIDRFRSQFQSSTLQPQLITDLKLTIKPLLLRRTKKQIKLELPEKIIQDVILPFGPEQLEIYKKVALSYSQQVDQLIQQQGEKKSQIAMFAALMRLRQICSDPSAVPGVKMIDRPIKIDHFLESIDEHFDENESILVFTQFLSTLHRISQELKNKNFKHDIIHGQIPAKERSRIIKEFSDSKEPRILLMTLKTGGVGLNLTKASVVYHLEPWWNPAVENQATDRAYRMGQTKNVKVYNLLIEGSLEERMVELKKRKSQIFNRLFDDSETIETTNIEKAGLSKEDFKFLISTEK